MESWHDLTDVLAWLGDVRWMTRAGNDPPPSPSEIETLAAEIRDAWGDDERGRRCVWAQNESPSTAELVSLEDLVYPDSNAPGVE